MDDLKAIDVIKDIRLCWIQDENCRVEDIEAIDYAIARIRRCGELERRVKSLQKVRDNFLWSYRALESANEIQNSIMADDISTLQAENEELAGALHDRQGYIHFLHEYTRRLQETNAEVITRNERLRSQLAAFEKAWDEMMSILADNENYILSTSRWLLKMDDLDPRKDGGG